MATIPAQTFDGWAIPEITFGWSNIQPSTSYTPGTYTLPAKIAMIFWSNNSQTYPVYIGAYAYSSQIQMGYGLTLDGSFTYDNKTVYYRTGVGSCRQESYDPTGVSLNPGGQPWSYTQQMQRIMWLMVYGGYYDGYDVTYDLQNCTGDADNPSILRPETTVANFDFIADTDADFNSSSVWIDGSGFPSGTPVVFSWSPETGHLRIGPVTSNIVIHVHAYKDPYNNLPTGGDDPIPGAGAVPEPGLPGLSASSTGIMGLFCPTVAQMQQLSDFMWTDFGGQGTTVIEVLEEIVEAIKRAISNPLDYIFGLNIIPSQGLSIGNSKVVKFGFVNSGVSMPVLTDHYFIVDCGSVSFDVLCGDSFLDYAPYSKFSIYLPYIGFKDIDPNDCVGHTISVKYHGDAITGGLTAYVFKDGNVMYQYSGGCALNVPLSADNWGATIASAASIATGVISAAATGGAAGVGVAAAKGAASVAANPSLLSPQVMHSGAVSGAPGFMGVQYPFIIREAVNFHSTVGFNKESGYPAYYYKSLSEVAGFTTVLDPHINNIPQATQSEMAEIISLLESGVIL